MVRKIKTASKQYWEDSKWANRNFTKIVRQYPDKYVALYAGAHDSGYAYARAYGFCHLYDHEYACGARS